MSHIDDCSLELYALGRVPEFEVAAIEEHLLVCPYCIERFESISEFATTIREATRMVTTELVATHRTEDGLVYLYVRQTGLNTWVATLRGDTIGGGVSATSRQTALELCKQSFIEMFPEHQCGRGCSEGPQTTP